MEREDIIDFIERARQARAKAALPPKPSVAEELDRQIPEIRAGRKSTG